MPKNKITIYDNTDGGVVHSRVRTIYIPGPSSIVTGEQILCTNTSTSSSAGENSLYYNQSERGWNQNSLSFKLAKYLIDTYGFNVIYEGIGSATVVPLESWKKLKYTEYNLDYITTGQFGYIDTNAIDVAYARKDCTYLADHSQNPLTEEYVYFKSVSFIENAPTDWESSPDKYFVKISVGEPLTKNNLTDTIPYIPLKYYSFTNGDEKNIGETYELVTSINAPDDWNSSWEAISIDGTTIYKSTKYGLLNDSGTYTITTGTAPNTITTTLIDHGYKKSPAGKLWTDNIYYERVGTSETGYTFNRLIINSNPETFDSSDYYISYEPFNIDVDSTESVSIRPYKKRYYFTKNLSSNIKDTGAYVSAVRNQFESKIGQNQTTASYAAGFTPWFYSNIQGLEDTEIPASFGYLFAYGTSIKNNPLWFASAGPDRGIIPELVSPVVNYNRLDVEVLGARAASGVVEMDETGDNVGVAINPIANIRPFGIILYGNRTLRYNQVDAGGSVGELKASSFLNIRNLVSLLSRTAKNAAERYKFDQNSSLLWNKFTSVLIPVLDDAVAGSGILGYNLKQQVAEKKARLKAKLTVIPIEAVEDLDLTIELTDSLDVTVTGE